jgi:hypothetical protein
MGVTLTAVSAVSAVSLLAAAAGCGSTGSKPAAPATQATSTQPTATQVVTSTRPAAPPRRFISKRYSFDVTLTKDWSGDDAQIAWNGKKLQGLGSPAFANFTDPASGRTLAAAAAPVAKGTRLAQWRAVMVRAAPPACTEFPSVKHTTFGGEPALAWAATCSDGYNVNKLASVHGTRGYIILLASPTANDNAKNRRTFDSIRRSFRFAR